MRRFGELDVRIADHLETIAPRVEEIHEGAIDQLRPGRRGQRLYRRAVVDDDAEMPARILVRRLRLHQGDELVAHVDEGLALAFAAQGEIEDLAVEGERFLDVADLEGDVVHADQLGLPRLRLRDLLHVWRSFQAKFIGTINDMGRLFNMGRLLVRSSGRREGSDSRRHPREDNESI